MGKLREVIANPTKEMTEETKEALNLLYELSEAKAQAFETQIAANLRTAGTVENPTIPITEILGSHQEIRVITSETTDQSITDNVSKSLKSMISGGSDNIINGITGLIDTGLHIVLGASKGEECFEKSYYIATDGLSIVRLDLMYWCRHISAANVIKHAEKSLVCTAVKSSVDLSKLSFNGFLSAYQKQLSRCSFSIEELKQEVLNAKEIYALFKSITENGLQTNNISANTMNLSTTTHTPLMDYKPFGVLESTKNAVSGIWPPIRA